MKPKTQAENAPIDTSLPIWERGLKHIDTSRNITCSAVAPYMGAWIETLRDGKAGGINGVAPYMGAWIETFWSFLRRKQFLVAPYMGAWIETFHAM